MERSENFTNIHVFSKTDRPVIVLRLSGNLVKAGKNRNFFCLSRETMFPELIFEEYAKGI